MDPTSLSRLWAEMLDHAVAQAALPPGLFTLTILMGDGKTLTSFRFAVEHAMRHGLRQAIYVTPMPPASSKRPRCSARRWGRQETFWSTVPASIEKLRAAG